MTNEKLYTRFIIVGILVFSALLFSCAAPEGENTQTSGAAAAPEAAFPSESIVFRTYRNLGDNVKKDTGLAVDRYECGIVGMAAFDGDINGYNAGDIIQTYMYENNGTWWIRADFRTHVNHENWNIRTICIDKQKAEPSAYFLTEFKDLGDNVKKDTTTSTSEYYCAIVGMAALDGDSNGVDAGDIIQTYMYENNGTWWIRADFRTHVNHENWNVNVLCVKQDSDVFHYEKFSGLGDNVVYPTTTSTRDYICGIVGMAALNGDIDEDNTGDIIRVFMFPGHDGNWTIRADFHTHDDHENWNVNVLCARRGVAVYDWAQGSLGDPTSDEIEIGEHGYVQRFQKGVILYNDQKGAVEIPLNRNIPNYAVLLEKFHVDETRSVFNDDAYVSFLVKVSGEPTPEATVIYRSVDGGDYYTPLSVLPIQIGDPNLVVLFNYAIVNKGHDKSGIEAKLKQAAKEAAEKGADYILQGLGQVASPGTGWLLDIAFADCDGVVVPMDQIPATVTKLDTWTSTFDGTYSETRTYPGTDSPKGCGSNSQYSVTWWIVRL